MKYKLINSVSKKETICDKVVVDGFDYYVSDEHAVANDFALYGGHITKKIVDTEWTTGDKKVIATTNPSIDIPKVVDEIEMLAWESTSEKYPDVNDKSSSQDELNIWNSNWMGFQEGYNKSQETHPFSEEDMIEFNEWQKSLVFSEDSNWLMEKSDKELLQLWKEQKPKIVYYE